MSWPKTGDIYIMSKRMPWPKTSDIYFVSRRMPWPKTGRTHYYTLLGFADKGQATKEFVVCWDLELLDRLLECLGCLYAFRF